MTLLPKLLKNSFNSLFELSLLQLVFVLENPYLADYPFNSLLELFLLQPISTTSVP